MVKRNRVVTCCVASCANTAANSEVGFHSFPLITYRFYQRNKWIQAIKNRNGPDWKPYSWSVVCSQHFVSGHPNRDPQNIDYIPSIFVNKKKDAKSVSIKRFALEYIKHEDLLEPPWNANVNSTERKRAYNQLASAFDIDASTVRAWERRFRDYVDKKWKQTPAAKRKPSYWLTVVAKRLKDNHIHRQSAGGVVAALVSAARARGVLCSTPLYHDVRRALRLAIGVSDLHAVWVSAQRVSLTYAAAAARAGDLSAPPAAAAAVADLFILHTDVEAHRLLSDESVVAYEESAALHTLWQLVQRHRLEDDAPPLERARRWSRALTDYRASGRSVSLVVLQRRWHELKLQARERLAAHWRRGPSMPELGPERDPERSPELAPEAAPAPTSAPCPPPAPLHINILKRYPHIATAPFDSWRQLVLDGAIVTVPQEEECGPKETQTSDEQQPFDTKPCKFFVARKLNLFKTNENDFEEAGTSDDQPFDTSTTDFDTTDFDDLGTVERLYPNLSKVDDPSIEQSSDDDPTIDKHTVLEPNLFEQILVVDPLAEQTAKNNVLQRAVIDPKIELMFRDMLSEQNVVSDPLAESLASDAMDVRSQLLLNPDDKVVRSKRANSSDTDTDMEDNLIIDERSNNMPCSVKMEPVERTKAHSTDTVSLPAPLGNMAPTIEVLQMIDPSTVKTEILFESDEDDFQPCTEENKDEIEIKKEPTSICSRLLFADELPETSCDVTQRVQCKSEPEENGVAGDTPQFDPKLLMDTYVRLFKIDKCRAWKLCALSDNSVSASRFHKGLYTSTKDDSVKSKEININNFNLDEIAKTHSIRQLCSNIKQELLVEQLEMLEGKAPSEKDIPDWESDDDQPLLALRNEKPPKESEDKRDRTTVERELVEESSSDGELLTDESPFEEKKRSKDLRKFPSNHAASTIEWSAAFTPAYGRVRRVRLPDMEQLRRDPRAVAQVAPISAAVADEDDTSSTLTIPVDAGNEAPAEPRALDLPRAEQLHAALDELATRSCAERLLEPRAHCCAARRQQHVNDTRRRLGLPELPHTHVSGACTCCCARQCDAGARLAHQLRALHRDVERMRRKAARNPHLKPKQNPSSAAPPAPAPAPPAPPHATVSQSASIKKRCKKKRAPPPPPPPPAPPAPALDDYEEWQRQKSLNTQYFYINTSSSKDPKNKTAPTAPTAPTPSVTVPIAPTALASTALTAPAPPAITPTAPVPSAPATSALPRLAPAPHRPSVLKQHVPIQSVPTTPAPVPAPPAPPEHKGKPLSILEEYARSLSAKTSQATPGPRAASTATIYMALTVPVGAAPAFKRLYDNDTVDLTETINRMVPSNKITMTANISVQPSEQARASKTPRLMSLSKRLRDGDVIEIDDSDSDSNPADNDTLPINKPTNPAMYSKSVSKAKCSKLAVGSEPTNTDALSAPVSKSESVKPTGADATVSAPVSKKKKVRNTKTAAKARFVRPLLVSSPLSAVLAHALPRAVSRIPELVSLASAAGRCAARSACLAALPDFVEALRKSAAAAIAPDVYNHKSVASTQAASALPCGGTLLCVDGTGPPLMLPARGPYGILDPPVIQDHLLLTDAAVPTGLPTYWTLDTYSTMRRIVPDDDVTPEGGGGVGGGGGATSGQERAAPAEKLVCEKNHPFKILTALQSARVARRCVRAGTSLLLLHVKRARVLVLQVRREGQPVKHRASAHVNPDMLRELETLLDEAEDDEPPDDAPANQQPEGNTAHQSDTSTVKQCMDVD